MLVLSFREGIYIYIYQSSTNECCGEISPSPNRVVSFEGV